MRRDDEGGDLAREILARSGAATGRGAGTAGSVRSCLEMALVAVLIVTGASCTLPLAPPAADPRAADPHSPPGAGEVALPKMVENFRLSAKDAPVTFTEESLWEHLDGGAHEYIRLGFASLRVARYKAEGVNREVLAEIFTMKTPEAAGLAFTAGTLEGAEEGKLCGRSWTKGNFLQFQSSADYVRLTAYFSDPSTPGLLEKIARALCVALSSGHPPHPE